MNNIDKRALREAAEKALNARARLALMKSVFDDDGDNVKPEAQEDISICVSFNDLTNPTTVLALLDELEAEQRISSTWRKTAESNREKLEAAEKRIAVLEASHGKLREAMAGIHNTIRGEGAYTPLAAILNASKRAYEESAAAAGKGEAS